jgi:hypothetical protein
MKKIKQIVVQFWHEGQNPSTDAPCETAGVVQGKEGKLDVKKTVKFAADTIRLRLTK